MTRIGSLLRSLAIAVASLFSQFAMPQESMNFVVYQVFVASSNGFGFGGAVIPPARAQ